MTEIAGLAAFIRDTGYLAILIVVLYSLHKGWWVPGKFYDRAIERAERAEKRADEMTLIAAGLSRVTGRTVGHLADVIREKAGER